VTRAELLALVDEARHAPSVHNIQPARWAMGSANSLVLHADPERRLPIADPTGHDVRVSLGAAWEGMALALARRGFSAAPPRMMTPRTAGSEAPGGREREAGGDSARSVPFASLEFEHGAALEPLADAVLRRAAWRGSFAATGAPALDRLERRVASEGMIMVRDRSRIRELAKLADEAGDELLLQPGYWRETWRWLRLSQSHPGWSRDGLNADALALNGIERLLGRWLMAPAGFEAMRRLGLARALISERAKIESAGALLIFSAPVTEDPFETGRAFYRRWLDVTASGLALCPMSVLADSKRANQQVRGMFSLPAECRLVNVFRVGSAPAGFPAALTPRLPAEELLVD
jgi:nitroreductase